MSTITDRWCCDVCSTTVSFDYLSVREASNYIGRHVDRCHPHRINWRRIAAVITALVWMMTLLHWWGLA